MNLNSTLRYGDPHDPFYVEYNRRKGHYSMAADHMHGQHELYYLFGGERFYFIKDRAYQVQSGDLVIVPGDEVHKTSDTGVPNHERIVLYYDERYFAQFGETEAELLRSPFRGTRRLLRLDAPGRLRVEQLLYGMLREIQDRPPGSELPIRHAAAEMLLFAARHALGAEAEAAEEATSPTAAKMTEVARHIAATFREPITLDKLSGRFYLSPSYLSRAFKRCTGFGIAEYVGITRVKEAQRLLRETDARITEVSEEAGFENFSHFEKVFKAFTRMTPRSYRAQFRRSL
ncbi:AraC family transcriptional regulator [Cohnella ginsengisoli]|uniref:AraC family transcriptional regulator n=1 Tax=Cohnella ginsengisoli TaxID=425004 RepID=A0A9X4KN07_9BACL|nr:AraC family transcriptional regulator [Cohnella ginsengisoli]MDG0794906.1 AraC family transcriptional regulator [Cohnella ginsengisoli]